MGIPNNCTERKQNFPSFHCLLSHCSVFLFFMLLKGLYWCECILFCSLNIFICTFFPVSTNWCCLFFMYNHFTKPFKLLPNFVSIFFLIFCFCIFSVCLIVLLIVFYNHKSLYSVSQFVHLSYLGICLEQYYNTVFYNL